MNVLLIAMSVLFLISVGISVYFYLRLRTTKENVPNISEIDAIKKASSIAKTKVEEAEKLALDLEKETQKEIENNRRKVREQEQELNIRENKIVNRSRELDKRKEELEKSEKEIDQKKEELKVKFDELNLQLEKIAQLTRDEAVELLKKEISEELTDWEIKKIKETEVEIKEKKQEISKKILVETMASSVVDYVSEATTTTLELSDESLKSRIIGRSGRNIRAFERITGVDVIIDEAPNEVTISCFDPIRREVAHIAMQKLLKTGKINPSSIEETIEKVKTEVLKEIKKTGEDMAFDAGFSDLPNEIIMLLGRFKYRYSYGQNMVKHTMEVIQIGEALANEVGADLKTVKLACLLHDIGKVAPKEGKQHHHISADIARKYWPENKQLLNAIEAHHEDIEAEYVEAEIVKIADIISSQRPGARRESYEDYVTRIRNLEDIANRQEGVKNAFAIRTGKEVRVIVNPEKVNDDKTKKMAYEIAKEIEKSGNYPGVVKVSVIREYRVKEEAK